MERARRVAWWLRTVATRAAATRAVTGTAALVVLIATTAVLALVRYDAEVTAAGLRRGLAALPAAERSAQISTGFDRRTPDCAGLDAATARVSQVVTALDLPLDTHRSLLSATYGLTERRAQGAGAPTGPEVLVAVAYDDLAEHARLRAGRWPDDGTAHGSDGEPATVEAAVHERTARALDLAPGSMLHLADRLGARPLTVRVSGLYVPKAADDPFWFGEPVESAGRDASGSSGLVSYGPLALTRASWCSAVVPDSARWRLAPRVESLNAGDLERLRDVPARLTAELGGPDPTGATGSFVVASGLDTSVPVLSATLSVTRAITRVPSVLLTALGATCLLLVSGLLGAVRRRDHGLLIARGASRRLTSGLGLLEALLLALPAVVLAPPLSGPVLVGAAHATGSRIESLPVVPDTGVWLLGALLASLAALLVTVPGLRLRRASADEAAATRAPRSRGGALQQGGIDLALTAVAALLLWQLDQYGARGASRVAGVEVDPVVVLAPTALLVAGALLAARLLVPFAAAAERLLHRRRGLAFPLALVQVGRDSHRHAATVVLLGLACATATYAVAFDQTWARSQREQADHAVGTDLRVAPPLAGVAAPGTLGLAGAYAGLPEVEQLSPALEQPETLRDGTALELVALDAAAATDVLRGRYGESDETAAALARLAEHRPPRVGPVLPPGTRALRVTVTLEEKAFSVHQPQQEVSLSRPGTVTAVVSDATGVLSPVSLGEVPSDGRLHALTAPVPPPPAGDLRLAGFYLAGEHRVFPRSTIDWTLGEVEALGDGGPITTIAHDRSRWSSTLAPYPQYGSREGNILSPRAGVDRWAAQVKTGRPGSLDNESVVQTTLVAMTGAPAVAPVPMVATNALLDTGAARLGKTVALPTLDVEGEVMAALPGLPTVDPGTPAALIDLPSLQAAVLSTGRAVPGPTSWWLATPDGGEAAARALANDPALAATVVDRLAAREDRLADPLGSVLLGALVLGLAGSLLLAATGYAASVSELLARRSGQTAVLRALGLSPRGLVVLVGGEQAVLAAFATVAGVGLGALVARLTLAEVLLDSDGSPPVPTVLVEVPWGYVAAALGTLFAVLFASSAFAVLIARRAGLGSALRWGAEG